MKLLIASRNLNKLREMRTFLKKLDGCEVYSLKDFPNYTPPEETGKTFEENAILKATDAAKALNMTVLADDSGLVTPALDGRPGIYSSRYAGNEATDLENRKKLISEIKDFSEEKRNGYFECVLCLAGPNGVIKTVRGLVEGYLVTEEKGSNGFGYDPIFVKHEYSKTFAQLDEMTKNEVSHRRKAMDKLLPILEELCSVAV
jgi:XTP/dITP diphosphohydrolase